ncbi:hypothetical protein BE1S18E01_21400 [Acinetobacter sp. BEC1-S18-ESBL-01]|jgi:hypothetical protein|uniref:hypothetical protein n=1 Tax=Acinetobacter TaxID=469 RepID=UPI0002CEBC9F|nr:MULTISPECIES: hypothetical protein [Acinetobacter]AMO41110.1 hypothetical protein A0J50_10930 [Acinetobacter sp. DUT-2]ENW12502.1 hypothetical protein F930_02458 [Acinetobacter pittii ANC 3678]EXH33163.1 hypothetical protein J623_2446 [Acinetobacter sp. 1245249]EYT25484.1 hypothetical protein J622_02814 [Acinetobacter sp. 1564232]MCU4470852.1 hypothetical protein [Acinetobacter pittii]
MDRVFKLSILSFLVLLLSGCIGCYNPTGCNRDTSPYFYTKQITQVKGVTVPVGTKLVYKSQKSKQKNEQTAPLKEEHITGIKLPKDSAMLWGGMPTNHLLQFTNSEMQGFTAYRAQEAPTVYSNQFLKLWKECDSDLDISIKNKNDWSFNPANMKIIGCGINYQERASYNTNNPSQDKVDIFLIKINQALQKLPQQKEYPVIHYAEN